MSSRDRRIGELARVEFTGSMGEAIGHYSAALRTISRRWDTELGLASADVRAALVSIRGSWLGLDKAARRLRARRVARRLRRAQSLASALADRADRFRVQYARQFLVMSADEAKDRTRKLDRSGE
ncbi:hypothetical protein V5P93_000349 [Actinokineospora auranticolor]|uniref:Excreted virulence factor EspC (Type VII ESX diderm) n=1 Tax=Actinokineospora auranticolor TaxID=155976 RepID=A0A2S6GKJ6_9PSEU|nr:hypothetical protein [Actinokineospora auranticolor]PPK65764.1 hypothetical protein CLV40_11223 [Actinokineospora auranticolor]